MKGFLAHSELEQHLVGPHLSRLKTNYILVDYENVQPQSVARLKGGPYKLRIFVGSQKPRIPLELAHSMQLLGDVAEYVPTEGNGRNVSYFLSR